MSNTHEFQHCIPAAKIGREASKTRFEADARQCALLAKRYGILSVDSLTGEAELVRESDGMTIAVKGHFAAEVTQACVTTLEPVKDSIEEDFEGWFLDESQAKSFKKARKMKTDSDSDEPFGGDEDEETMMPAEMEDPEPVINGMVDVGELVAQYLSLALDPYPKSEKALAEGPIGDDSPPEKTSPFDVLKQLKT
ncbi:MAG: DUF177 domain-containing protein [Alphaproteobacteria bacterium]|nr:DUF177 domain-containing protein [Alphaproteobacteria bacterium]